MIRAFKVGDKVKFATTRDPELRGHTGTVTDVGKGVVYVDWGNGFRVRKEFDEHVVLMWPVRSEP